MSQRDRRTSDEIEHEIHQTRARLDETLHEIEERFSPQTLMNTTYDYLRHGGAENALSSLGRTIRENPLPVMVTGIGLGWLLLAQRRSGHDHDYLDREPYAGGYPGSTLPVTRMPDGDTAPGGGISGAGTTTLGHDPAALGASPQHGEAEHGHGAGMTHKAQQMAGNMRDRAQHMGGQVRDRAQHVSDQMRERAQHMGGQMRDRTSRLRDRQHSTMQAVSHRARDAGAQTSHFVQDHPLVAGALGIAMGAVLGSLFSPTRAENRHLGEMRDRALQRAEDAGRDQLARAEEKIHETADRLKEEARTAQPSNSSSYVENPSSEARYAKAGSASTSGSPGPGRETAAGKGGTGTSTASAGGPSGTTASGSRSANPQPPGASGSKPGDSGSTPSRGA
ncbi:DUF3618 domain-containing protein [Halomonas sp. MCCC 1A17488]|uniref:DUF3618 domain-containing protein n=1 Tax=unclassified Halomonas TaxID=2609666 RepID=UPI0018D21524|nr:MULTISPECIES: DUF3618 domain-containing protein [unclassified Halomonas]MCE8016583.1 DUF3618 domain-containing protein [Halomonas sp. MCCC 1A17488]MCG3239916.1 DUF3618 domain-containing protein [Halomonas sp. MCCC 1A17488]QPP50191.1 DUF3618 domain-containing protein [Halomonas sp. SS10-MC5]